jgi:hypothetical protein
MNRTVLSIAICITCAVSEWTAAGTIDTLPDVDATHGILDNSAVGQTFTAGGFLLESFAFDVATNGPNGPYAFRGVVMSTYGSGAPDALLWESSDQTAIDVRGTLFTFHPNLPLVVGEKYFVGADTGAVTTVSDGFIRVSVVTSDVIAGGSLWDNTPDSGSVWVEASPAQDLGVRITMVPEPTSLALAAVPLIWLRIAGLCRRR